MRPLRPKGKQSGKNRYRKAPGGGYVCPICGVITNSRQVAFMCCDAKKGPVILDQAFAILKTARQPAPPRRKLPGNNARDKDQWGHYRRGRKRSAEQTLAEYSKAMDNIDREHQADIKAQVNRLLTPPYKIKDAPPMKRLWFCYLNNNWPGVKAVALEIGRIAADNRHGYLRKHPEELYKKGD